MHLTISSALDPHSVAARDISDKLFYSSCTDNALHNLAYASSDSFEIDPYSRSGSKIGRKAHCATEDKVAVLKKDKRAFKTAWDLAWEMSRINMLLQGLCKIIRDCYSSF